MHQTQFGVGIQVGRRYWPKADFSTFLVENFIGQATITKTTVTGYQKNGITVDGPSSKANIMKSRLSFVLFLALVAGSMLGAAALDAAAQDSGNTRPECDGVPE